MGSSAHLVPLQLLLQLVEVAAGPAAHLAAAPGAALRPHCSGYVVTAAGQPAPVPSCPFKGQGFAVSQVSGISAESSVLQVGKRALGGRHLVAELGSGAAPLPRPLSLQHGSRLPAAPGVRPGLLIAVWPERSVGLTQLPGRVRASAITLSNEKAEPAHPDQVSLRVDDNFE